MLVGTLGPEGLEGETQLVWEAKVAHTGWMLDTVSISSLTKKREMFLKMLVQSCSYIVWVDQMTERLRYAYNIMDLYNVIYRLNGRPGKWD